jgi:hypothetical protein
VAPFHRLSLLAPWAEVGGYGSFGEYPRRVGALALRGTLAGLQHAWPIEFPPANTQISINALNGSEWPNPFAACAGYERPAGLPITLQTARQLVLKSYSLQDQSAGVMVQACGFDGMSYRNSDVTQQKRGRALLNAYGAIVLIPRQPLSYGHQYCVIMLTSQGRFEWDFRLKQAGTLIQPRSSGVHSGRSPQDIEPSPLPVKCCRSVGAGLRAVFRSPPGLTQ